MSTVAAAVHNLAAYAASDYEGFKVAMAELLGNVDPTKPFGTTLFDAIAKVSYTPAFEAVAVRMGESGPEVFLRKRAEDDTAYPGAWHAPGSVFRPGERPRDVANRLGDEFGMPITHFDQVGLLYDIHEQRGSFLSIIFLVSFFGEPRVDDRHGWFPMNDLPEGTVDFHAEVVLPHAVTAFLGSHWMPAKK